MADKTKIDWADATWNPVTGCLHGCKYCYARNIATRFSGYNHSDFCDAVAFDGKKAEIKSPLSITLKNGKTIRAAYPFGFAPTLHRYMLEPGNDGELPAPQAWQRPRNIFVCSMADLFGAWVPDEWIEEVFNVCREAPQHRYMFLTKAPERFGDLLNKGIEFPENCWFGTSVTQSADAEKGINDKIDWLTDTWPVSGVKWFVSVEPLLENLSDEAIENIAITDWVIIGAETGQRKDRVIPEKAWVDHIVRCCWDYGTHVFMKNSLREIMGDDFIQQFPWEANSNE